MDEIKRFYATLEGTKKDVSVILELATLASLNPKKYVLLQ